MSRVRDRSLTFPLAPLLAELRPGATDDENAARLGISTATFRGWRQGRRTRLGLILADRYAVRLGLHLELIWPTGGDIAAEQDVAS